MKGEHLVTHGMSKVLEYSKWKGMKARCRDAKEVHHHGKGIHVCSEWINDFPRFYAHIGPMPTPQHTVDRWPDANGNYESGNVRWATAKQQANNRCTNRMVVYRGAEMTFAEALDASGHIVSQSLAWTRVDWGWEVDRALDTPPRKGNYRRKNQNGQKSCEIR